MLKVRDTGLVEVHGENLAVEQLTYTETNRTIYVVRKGFQELVIEPQAALYYQFGPALDALWFYDASASTKWIDLIAADDDLVDAKRGSRATANNTGSYLNSMTTSDYIYIGCRQKHGGPYFDVNAANGDASAMAAGYSKSDGTFASATISDKTSSGGATLAQDGVVVLTVPTDWSSDYSLATILSDTSAPTGKGLYWLRLSVGTALDASVNLNAVALMNVNQDPSVADQAGGYGKLNVEYSLPISSRVGSIEFMAQANGDTTVNCTWKRYER